MHWLLDMFHMLKDRFLGFFYTLRDRFPIMRKTASIGIMLVVALLLVLGVKAVFFKKKAATGPKNDLFQVRAQKIKRQNYSDSYTVMGTIKGAVENDMRFEIDGQLASFNYREGDTIARGRVICSLDPKDSLTKAEYARLKYESEKANYQSAAQRMKVYEELFRMNAIAESKLFEARYETQSTEAKMKAALSELELAQSNLAKTNLAAPASGMLARIIIKPGEYVTPQDVVMKFISGGDTIFEVDVPEKDVSRLKTGLKAKISCDSFPNREFEGTVNEIAPTVEERTRTRTVKISVSDSSGMLRSGMFGRGQVLIKELQNVILVPNESVIKLGDTTSLVPVLKPDPQIPGEGTIEQRVVKLGEKLTSTTVIEEGLTPGEFFIAETQGQISDGIRVKFTEIEDDKKEPGGPAAE